MNNQRSVFQSLVSQISYSLVFKTLAIFVSLYSIRLQIEYLGLEKFGMWVLIFGVVNWLIFFDLGIANGLRNKVSEALSREDYETIQKYISTGLFAIFVFVSACFLVVLAASNIFDFGELLGVEAAFKDEVNKAVFASFVLVLTSFFFNIVNQLLHAFKLTNYVVFGQFGASFMAMILLFHVERNGSGNLLFVALVFGGSLVVSSLLLNVMFFLKYKSVFPKLSKIESKKIKELLSLGFTFFWLQVVILIIFSSDRLIIMHLFDSVEVAYYDILYRYLNIIVIFNSIVCAPLWAMFTHLKTLGQVDKMKQALEKFYWLQLAYVFIFIAALSCSKIVFEIWLGAAIYDWDKFEFIPMACMLYLFVVYTGFSNIMNGLQQTKGQLICGTIGALINVPLSIYFVKGLGFGVDGVLYSTLISLSFYCIYAPIELKARLNSYQARTTE